MKDYQIEHYSTVLKRTTHFRCLVPKGTNLKCLFLLHGYGGNHNQWCDESIVSQLAERYNLVVVMPGCGNGYYEDTNEDIPSFIGEELVAVIRKTLPVSHNQEDTFIGGVSMGGFGALLIGAKYNNVFGKIVSLSGAFIIPDVVIGNQGVLGNAEPQYFKDIFGDLETLEGSNRDPVAEAICMASAASKQQICFLCGTEDPLYQCNSKVVKALRKNNIPVVWHSSMGKHCWDYWNALLLDIFKWLVEDCAPEGADDGDNTSVN